MRKRYCACALCGLVALSSLAYARRGGGAANIATSPLSLPLLTTTQANSMFAFLGSFSVPDTRFAYGGNALAIDGNTMYMTSMAYQPNGANQVYDAFGSFTIPTLSGTPAYDGSNGTVSTASIEGPNAPGVVAPVSYALQSSVASGATSATFTSLPPGMTANAGWYIDFNSSNNELVTGVSGNTVSWSTPTTAAFSSPVSVYRWDSSAFDLWSNSNGGKQLITGAYVSAGNLYVTGAGQYDGSCNGQLGWVTKTSASTIGPNWGTINTLASQQGAISNISWSSGTVTVTSSQVPVSGVGVGTTFPAVIAGVSPSGYNGAVIMTRTGTDTATYTLATDPGTVTVTGTIEPTERGRYFAGEIEPVPSTWQSLFGSVFETSGPELSVDGCNQSSGPTFQEFSLANVSQSGNAVPTQTDLAYSYDFGAAGEYLQGRSLSGPFPLAENDVGANYYPATLDSAPSSGATSVSITLPSSVSGTATFTNNSTTMNLTAINSGTLSDSGMYYSISDTSGVVPSGTQFYPAYQFVPGTTLSTGNYTMAQSATGAVTGDTVTLAPGGFDSSTSWKIWFSDGESRIGTWSLTSNVETLTFSPALTGSSITTAVTVAPMGDNYSSAYDGSYAGAFIVPNTRTLITAWVHNSGPHTDKGSSAGCSANSSGNYSTPLVPDTAPYQSIRLYLYDLQDVENGAQGTQPVYQANPYGFLDFPDSANLFPSGCVSLPNVYASGFMRFDPSNDILYMATGSGAPIIVDEYKVTPP